MLAANTSLAPDGPLRARRNLARLLLGTGRAAEGEALMREVLDDWRAAYGENHPEVAFETARLASVLARDGTTEESLAMFTASLAVLDDRVGPNHMWAVQARIGLGRTLAAPGQWEAAETVLREAAVNAAAAPPGAEKYIADAALVLGECLLGQGKRDDAARVAAEAMRLLSERPPPGEDVAAACLGALDRLAGRSAPPP